MKSIIKTKNAPAAIGPYSQAAAAGGFLFVSGQIPINPATGNIESNTIELQAKQVFSNIKAILAEANVGLESVVKTTLFLKNIDDFAAVNEIYALFFKKDCPARSAAEVSSLPKNALIECEVIAYLG